MLRTGKMYNVWRSSNNSNGLTTNELTLETALVNTPLICWNLINFYLSDEEPIADLTDEIYNAQGGEGTQTLNTPINWQFFAKSVNISTNKRKLEKSDDNKPTRER